MTHAKRARLHKRKIHSRLGEASQLLISDSRLSTLHMQYQDYGWRAPNYLFGYSRATHSLQLLQLMTKRQAAKKSREACFGDETGTGIEKD